MKESIYSPYNKLVKRITLNDEQTLRKGGGVPTDVTFSEGKGTFNGTSSKINYNLGLNGTYSVRIRCNPTNFAGNTFLLDMRGTNEDGAGLIFLTNATGILGKSSGTAYVNGVATTSTTSGVQNEIIVTGITLTQGTGANLSLIGSRLNNTDEFLGTMDLVEIYSGTLTASEVSNLYNDRWNREQSFGSNTLIDFDSTQGILELHDLNDASTATDVTVNKNGALFNGTTSGIDLGVLDNTGIKSTCGWIYLNSFGENNAGHILSDNDYFNIYVVSGDVKLGFSRNGSTTAYSANDTMVFNKWIFFYISSAADGTTNIYLGDINNAPVLSGSADQAAGAPQLSTSATHIGNRTADDRSFDGYISILKDISGDIGLNSATQVWSETRKEIN